MKTKKKNVNEKHERKKAHQDLEISSEKLIQFIDEWMDGKNTINLRIT